MISHLQSFSSDILVYLMKIAHSLPLLLSLSFLVLVSLLVGGSLYTRESSKPGKSGRHIGRVSGTGPGTSEGENLPSLTPLPLALSLVPDLPLTRPIWRPDLPGFELSRVYKLPPAGRLGFSQNCTQYERV